MNRVVAISFVAFFVFIGQAVGADTLSLRLVSETSTTITLGWDVPIGANSYTFWVLGVRVANTQNGSRNTAKFAKVENCEVACFQVIANTELARGTYPPAVSSGANLWVDTNGGSCTRTATLGSYSDTMACPSFATAYAAAQSGDAIGVVSGNYGNQFFAGGYLSDQGSGSKVLTFQGQPGNKIRAIHFGSPNLTFDGIDVDAGGEKTSGGAAFENGGAAFTFKNGRIGNVVDEKGALVTESGIVFDNVTFHDVVLQTEGVHNECMFAAVPEGMIVRNSTFTNCAVMDIFFVYPDWWSPLPPPYGNVTLDGNTFGHPEGTYTLYIGKIGTSIASSAPVTGWKVRNNRFEGPINSDAPYGSANIFCGNAETTSGFIPPSWKSAC